ncbi:MAG: MBL fold metallo-hydrolase [Pseudomonadota bacterium]
MPASLPVAAAWLRAAQVAPGITQIDEPHIAPLLRANMWLLEGRDRDVLVDSGMGVIALRPFLDAHRAEPGKPIVHVCSHAHIDHIGAVHEFDEVLVHPAEAADLTASTPLASLFKKDWPEALLQFFRDCGCGELDEVLIDALPHAGYDPAGYRLVGKAATGLLREGDVVDLGDRAFEILHLPGHSAGGIGLLDRAAGTLISGDAVYDGPLLPTGDMEDYGRTLRRLAALEVSVVHAGHDPSFGQDRLRAICENYLERWEL